MEATASDIAKQHCTIIEPSHRWDALEMEERWFFSYHPVQMLAVDPRVFWGV
jgi:hypothetical protein